MNDLVYRLRLRIDQLLADRDRAREQLAANRVRLRHASNRASRLQHSRDMWKNRALRR